MSSTDQGYSARLWREPDITADRANSGGADGPSLPSAEPHVRQHLIAAAMSWLMACIIEGFAAVAYAHYPYFTGQSDPIAAPDWERQSRPAREEGNGLWLLASNPWVQEPSGNDDQTNDGKAWRVVE
jgi:hypothetical protein